MAPNSKKSGYFCHKCKKDNEDFMIHCFSCDANFHATCVGLKGRMIDKMNFDDGFHYYCLEHRKLSVSALLNKLSIMKKLNIQLIALLDQHKEALDFDADSLLLNLETKKGANLIEENKFNDLNSPKSTRSPSKRILRNSATSQKRRAVSDDIAMPKNKFGRIEPSCVSDTVHSSPGNIAANLDSVQIPEVTQITVIQSEPVPIAISDQTLLAPLLTCADNSKGSISNAAVQMECDEDQGVLSIQQSSQEQLIGPALLDGSDAIPTIKCVPPPRSIYVSGIDPEVNDVDLEAYVTSKLQNASLFKSKKMVFKEPKPYASFVIDVGRNAELFDRLCDPSFWPKFAVVREYEFFRKMNPRAPKLLHRQPQN